ncbi:iron ABC transporter permease [Rhodobacteraceae bacterium F11138]|nr:iron ABC transporter permease [Rhodobacteraceae bacterium F11138]
MRTDIVAVLFALCLGSETAAQGFADLGTTAEGFAVPQRNTVLEFPADHGAHPQFRIEWWYLTATLSGPDGQPYGVQWTLFRSALQPQDGTGWQSPQLWMGHAAVTSATQHLFAERLARGGIGQAGVTASPFSAWIDNWQMTGDDDAGLDNLRLTASGSDFRYELRLDADAPLVLHGEDGYSVKSAKGQASHYYSQPAYAVEGVLYLDDQEIAVTGQGWLDREWSSQPLSPDQTGWDWFSLSFDSGARMMGFRLRGADADYTSATWIEPDGSSRSLPDGALVVEPLGFDRVAGRSIPTRWRLRLPARNLDVKVNALNPNSWMNTTFPYWEGPVSIIGSHTGGGYLEMTGYD